MNKAELLVSIAGLPEDDPRLERLAATLSGQESPPPPPLRLFRMNEAAKETGLSRCTIWRAIREKRLKTVEIRRGSHRISEAELRRFAGIT